MDLIRKGLAIASNPSYSSWLSEFHFITEVAFCTVIVHEIAYTEIDWIAYMQQVSQFIAGERDYIKFHGDTGPLVYPAAHVYIYRFLYYITDHGRDIRMAQYIFMALYLLTLRLVMACYRQAKVPPYVFPLLVLSKRLHSIFLLRLFNDGFAVFFLFAAIYCYQRKLWTVGSLAFSLGLGVKMSLLLALPAVGVVLWQGMGRNRAVRQAMLMGQVQVLLGYPFLASNARSYLSKAFEFDRQFMFKWTVNWRFVGEETFLSKPFSIALLGGHAAVLILFLATKWLRPSKASLPEAVGQLFRPPPSGTQAGISERVTPDFVLTTILTAINVGCLFARSLHYQFYAYIAWAIPFLLWRSGMHPVLIYATWAAQEWAWNVYPSTNISSIVVVSCLAIATVGSWLGRIETESFDAASVKHENSE